LIGATMWDSSVRGYAPLSLIPHRGCHNRYYFQNYCNLLLQSALFLRFISFGRIQMLELLITAILTSAVDSLNPVAITQQFVLQGMVKRPRDIWYFILPTGITNFIGGFLAYYGLVSIIGSFFDRLIGAYRQ